VITVRRFILASLFLVLSAHRSPAPIQELPDNPTPKPVRSLKPAPKKIVQPKTTPSATPQSKATPSAAPVTASDQAAITATVTELENKWAASVASHEVSQVDAFIADDYVSVSSAGKVLNKSALLEQLQNDTNVYENATVTDVNVRVVRPDFAIITGLTREKGKGKDGKAFNHSFRFTDTWVKRDGQWRCTNAQVVRIAEK
jgi:ketosteroid isomerase-like protein